MPDLSDTGHDPVPDEPEKGPGETSIHGQPGRGKGRYTEESGLREVSGYGSFGEEPESPGKAPRKTVLPQRGMRRTDEIPEYKGGPDDWLKSPFAKFAVTAGCFALAWPILSVILSVLLILLLCWAYCCTNR